MVQSPPCLGPPLCDPATLPGTSQDASSTHLKPPDPSACPRAEARSGAGCAHSRGLCPGWTSPSTRKLSRPPRTTVCRGWPQLSGCLLNAPGFLCGDSDFCGKQCSRTGDRLERRLGRPQLSPRPPWRGSQEQSRVSPGPQGHHDANWCHSFSMPGTWSRQTGPLRKVGDCLALSQDVPSANLPQGLGQTRGQKVKEPGRGRSPEAPWVHEAHALLGSSSSWRTL